MSRHADMRPTPVTVAVALLAAGLIVSLAQVGFRLLADSGSGASVAGFVIALALYVAMGGLVAAIAYGRRWALVAYFVLFVLSLPSLESSLAQRLDQGVAGLAWAAAATAVEVIALGLLISRPSRVWFAAAEKASAVTADASLGEPALQPPQSWEGRHGPKR